MNRLSILALGGVLASVGIAAAQGMQHGPSGMDMKGHMGMEMKAMDANGDGKISKDEFMRFHEAMFDKMKGKDGAIAVSDMQAMHGDCPMMQGGDKGMGHAGTMDRHQGMMGGDAKK